MKLLCAVLAECFYTGASITFKAIKWDNESDSQYQLWWDHFWSTCYSRSPLNNLIFQGHLWSTLLCRSLGDFPLSREEHGRWMDLLYVIQSLCRQACSSHNSTCTICQIRHKETNSETVTLSIFMQVVDVVFYGPPLCNSQTLLTPIFMLLLLLMLFLLSIHIV